MTIITIDGNIGSGKTSVLNYLHRNYKLPVDLEPVDNWNTYLKDLYEDSSNVFKFQVRIWLDRCWIQEKPEKNTILIERSPQFIKNVFVETALEYKMINQVEKELINDLHKKTDELWDNNIYIYLRTSPENCFKRIKKRNRISEKNITLDYIECIHNKHETTLQEMQKQNKKIICFDVDNKTISEIANDILNFISTLQK